MKRTLILGARGMLGAALVRATPGAVARGREVDITREQEVVPCIVRSGCSVVLNAAAYTDVDGCEETPEHAFRVNGEALMHIAHGCRLAGAVLVHFSTNYVFDGSSPRGYRETDPPAPCNTYGKSKLLGEQIIREMMDDYRIIRTSWLFGINRKNIVERFLELSAANRQVRIVADQHAKPTYTSDLVQRIPHVLSSPPGIYHVTNEGACSLYTFACAVIPNAIPISSEEFGGRTRRPKCGVLLNTAIPPLRGWREALTEYLTIREERSLL